MDKPKLFTKKDYKTCPHYECGGYCSRMDYLFDERAEHLEVCPLTFNPDSDRYEKECPYYEPQATIDEEKEMEEMFNAQQN